MTSKVVGEGTYGCVLKPSLHCSSSSNPVKDYENTVSKVMKENDAIKEGLEYIHLSKIKGLEKYAIIGPTYCKPELDNNFIKSIKHCKNKRVKNLSKTKTAELSLLIYQDGGINLHNYLNEIFPKETLREQKIFLTSLINLFDGLIFFRKNDIIHRDIKLLNIVYNIYNGECKFIDFGLMTIKDKYKNNCRQSIERFGIDWAYFPPENICSNKSFFNSTHQKCINIKTNFKDHEVFLEHMVNTFDAFCLTLSLMRIILELKRANFKPLFILHCSELFSSFCCKDAKSRKTDLNELKTRYVDILKNHGYYTEDKPNPSDNVEKYFEKIVTKEMKSVDECPPDKPNKNPKTGRCVKDCKNGFIRNKDFKCVNGIKKSANKKSANKKSANKKSANKTTAEMEKECKSIGKVFNAKTRRCNKIKKTEKKKTSAEKESECKSLGKVYNPITKRCNKINLVVSN